MKQIELTQGQVALVDDEDFEWLSKFKWCATKIGNKFYAKRGAYIKETQGTNMVLMHRQILRVTDRKVKVDHIDHDGLNNQRSNLRLATQSQNISHMVNRGKGSSKYLGVYRTKRYVSVRWIAEITKNYIKTNLGSFDTEEQAALAYNKAAKEVHGEFASLNII